MRLDVASRRVESCGMDATGMRERRPKSQILINRTPGGRECGVQNGRKLWNGRHGETAEASEITNPNQPDAR